MYMARQIDSGIILRKFKSLCNARFWVKKNYPLSNFVRIYRETIQIF